ncbi:MAG TPA: hypothetical protein VFY71_12895, partial [Planctomycetota bacterium]|nr:hypothetical protein [Planctomycetota bacterium]
LLVGVGLGLLSRTQGKIRMDAIALTLLVPLRGPLSSLALMVLPGGLPSLAAVAMITLLPTGAVLGRALRPCTEAPVPWLLVGVVLGELAVAFGATGWLPAWLAGALVAALLLALDWHARPREDREPKPEKDVFAAVSLLMGATLGLLLIVLQRVAASYATPTPHTGFDATLTLLLPAALVAVPAALLSTEGWPRRTLGAIGGVLLTLAVMHASFDVQIHDSSMAHVGLSRALHSRALIIASLLPTNVARALDGAGRQVDVWAWLLVFAGQLAAAGGVALGARKGRELGWMVLGGGLAAAAQYTALSWPAQSTGMLLLAAATLAAATVPFSLWGPRGALALPLALAPLIVFGGEEKVMLRVPPEVESVRRVGEFGVDAFQRTTRADVVLFLAPGRGANGLEGRQAFQNSFTGVAPAFRFDQHGQPEETCVPEPEPAFGPPAAAAPAAPEAAPDAEPRNSRGLRVGGVPLYAGDPPLGPEGSVSRLTRLFAPKGAAFVTGLGAELLAADLHDADLAGAITVSSPVPFGRELLAVLLDDCGSSGWQAGEVTEPVGAARDAASASYATVLVAPGPADLPGVSALLTEEHLDRLAELLAPGGRCLVWVETQGLTSRALAARLAAFGSVFGARSAAFVEPRGLDAPGVLLVGWRDADGAPSAMELGAHLPGSDTTGLRAHLKEPADLAALLVLDGPGLQALADDSAVLSRSRPIAGSSFTRGGWAALEPLVDPQAKLSRVVAGAPDGQGPSRHVLAGLVAHTEYDYDVEGLNNMMLEIKPDVEWSTWDREVAEYERAALANPNDPLLQLVLAALLEPLAVVGDFGRFAQVYGRCGGSSLPSWRLALQEWWVQKGSLEPAAAQAAADRARVLAGITQQP